MERSRFRLLGLLLVALLAALSACDSDEGRPASNRPNATSSADGGVDEDGGVEIPCGDAVCHSPSLCITSSSAATCTCPIGYVDVRGDGSVCQDVDECRIPFICDWNGKCSNTRGSYKCECAEPALVARGNRCVCGEGYRRSLEGLCLAEDGRPCTDNLDCLNNHCEGGTCCAVRCDRPGECQTSEQATCADGKSCEYPLASDGTVCDDAKACTADTSCQSGLCTAGTPLECDDKNPCTDDACEEPFGCITKNNTAGCDDHNLCTSEDHCTLGSCGGTSKQCDSDDDACQHQRCDPHTGECMELPVPDGTPCNDGSTCTLDDTCAAGSCSAHLAACGPNAVSCSAAAVNVCTCRDGFVDNGRGRCVPMTDECTNAGVCGANSDCDDPSNVAGDVVCSCKPGYAGNGVTCNVVDPCLDNPCGEGRGSCSASSEPGEHVCSCNVGYRAMNDTCVCDLSGTFAARSRMDLEWERMTNFIEPGDDAVYSYAIERHSYDERGNLTLELTSCGESALDFCGVGVPPMVAAEAYSQFLPVHIWDLPSLPKITTAVRVERALPGAAFETPLISSLRGLSLDDPRGAWPASFRDVAGTPAFDGTATNGARWLDQDDDGFVGITTFVVPPGGLQPDGTPPDPGRAYGAVSPVCPRTGGAHTPYAYWPVPAEGVSTIPLRVKRIYTAARVTSFYKGKINSCDEIAGDILGADGGPVQLEARIGGCIRENGDGETACSNTAIDFIDLAAQSETVRHSSFLLKRWPSDRPVNCAAARGFNYD